MIDRRSGITLISKRFLKFLMNRFRGCKLLRKPPKTATGVNAFTFYNLLPNLYTYLLSFFFDKKCKLCKLKLDEVLIGTPACLSEALRDNLLTLDASLDRFGLGPRIFTGLVDNELLDDPTPLVAEAARKGVKCDPLPPDEAAKLLDDLRDGIKFDKLVDDTLRETDGEVLFEDEREPDLRPLGPRCGKLGRSNDD